MKREDSQPISTAMYTESLPSVVSSRVPPHKHPLKPRGEPLPLPQTPLWLPVKGPPCACPCPCLAHQ